MLETQTKTIDGHKFTVTQLPAMRGLRMFRRLGSAVAPAIARAVESAKAGGDLELASAASAVDLLFSKLTEDELEAITRELLSQSTMDDMALFPSQFDLKLSGRIETVLKLLAFAVEVNYRGFFDALRGVLTLRPPRAPTPPPSTSASTLPTGQPGG